MAKLSQLPFRLVLGAYQSNNGCCWTCVSLQWLWWEVIMGSSSSKIPKEHFFVQLCTLFLVCPKAVKLCTLHGKNQKSCTLNIFVWDIKRVRNDKKHRAQLDSKPQTQEHKEMCTTAVQQQLPFSNEYYVLPGRRKIFCCKTVSNKIFPHFWDSCPFQDFKYLSLSSPQILWINILIIGFASRTQIINKKLSQGPPKIWRHMF